MGRIISQKNKSKVIRAFRAPSAPVVMSLMALILICAAPALVSVIDADSSSTSYDSPIVMPPRALSDIGFVADTPEEIVRTYSTLDYDGGYSTALDRTASAKYLAYESVVFDKTEDMRFDKIVISVDGVIKNIQFTYVYNGLKVYAGLFTPVLDASGASTGVYEYVVSSLHQTRILSDGCTKIGYGITFLPDNSLISWSVDYEFYSNVSIPYGEIIIGATGVLLIVCAILATPWVGTTGLTVKRRRSA